MARTNFHNFRLLLLLFILLFVAVGAWLDHSRSTSWDRTLWTGIYPLNGDGSEKTDSFIRQLRVEDFKDITEFFSREAQRLQLGLEKPVDVELGALIDEQPPHPPAGRNAFKVMFWSLKLRFWAWQQQRAQDGPDPDIRMYVVFYDPDQYTVLAHSLGLKKGLIGVVNAFASRSMMGTNNVVLAHELLHTLGANDRYDPATSLPLFPHGYAEPDRRPLFPQSKAEIMGGRTVLSETEAETPRNLKSVIIGPLTAAEIHWIL
ncbi:MAG: hypothetical protein KJO35_03160 [Gammaproteobacteria bacterium]|nr:hypothetical protein [Gammaproteobacteria bacterium]